MRSRTIGVCFFLLCTPLFAQGPLPDTLHGADKLVALLKGVSQMQRETTTLAATFEQRRVSHLLAAPSVSRGKFYFKAPDEVRWEYEAPREMVVVLAGGTAITYRPLEKRAERVQVGRAQRRVFRFLGAAEPLEELQRYFSFTFRDRGPGYPYELSLQPTARMLKKRIKDVVLQIDRTTLMPIAVSYAEPDGDTTSYAFSDVVRNGALPAGLFHLELPPDVRVVEINLKSREE
ncbi:MAG: LolA family protein [Acidobacteriota bacterium]